MIGCLLILSVHMPHGGYDEEKLRDRAGNDQSHHGGGEEVWGPRISLLAAISTLNSNRVVLTASIGAAFMGLNAKGEVKIW